jgi:endonuclease/exonuclease/phosphatase (EEP) superfamily protein YafD
MAGIVMNAAGVVLIALAAILFAARYVSKPWQPAAIAATFTPYGVVVATSGFLCLMAAGSTVGAVLGALLAVALLVAEVSPWIRARSTGTPCLTVLTCNLWKGQGSATAVMSAARAQNVDVIALQEVTDEAVAALVAAGVETDYPHSALAPAPLWNGVAIWSRVPLRDIRTEAHGTLLRVEATIGIDPDRPGDDPTLVCVHIHAPWPGPAGPWHEQLAGVRTTLRRSRPVIVAGDFNATLGHQPFRAVLRAGSDAAVTSGSWWLRTYPAHRSPIAVACIDHIVTQGLVADYARTLRIEGTDHNALVARLERPVGQPT